MALAAGHYPPSPRSRTYFELRRDLPYVIHEAGLLETQILVNREYKPVGSNVPAGLNWVRYEDYQNLHIHLYAAQIAAIRTPPYEAALFGDGSAPWLGRREADAYLRRLSRLLDFLS